MSSPHGGLLCCFRSAIVCQTDRRFKIAIRFLIFALTIWLPWAAAAQDRSFTLALPEDLVADGFDKHVFTRFRFKHRIAVEPVAPGTGADATLAPQEDGTRVFAGVDGDIWRLTVVEDLDGYVKTFLSWLKSDPGKAALESFAPDGTVRFTTTAARVAAPMEEAFDGDTATGSRLALVHCGRCHVVDQRNRMGGIGSSPSFAALRAREDWSDLFRAFWSHNPHPSFTRIEGVSEPLDGSPALHVAPVEITLDEIEAITAFVATLKPKDLGRPVEDR